MTTRTLFLAWQGKQTRQWFPVGRLDVSAEDPYYSFRYTGGAKRAMQEAVFPMLMEFPDLVETYQSPELFSVFQNRIMNRARPDFADYLRNLGLHEEADPIEILAVNGGSRVTDKYEVFPKLDKQYDGSFTCRFFLHGWRHVSQTAQERLAELNRNEKLYMTLELANPATGLAVQMQTTDYHMIGWTPRYLVNDLAEAMSHAPDRYRAKVVKINPQPAPSKQRVLIEMTGDWGKHEPMASEDFVPLVSDTP